MGGGGRGGRDDGLELEKLALAGESCGSGRGAADWVDWAMSYEARGVPRGGCGGRAESAELARGEASRPVWGPGGGAIKEWDSSRAEGGPSCMWAQEIAPFISGTVGGLGEFRPRAGGVIEASPRAELGMPPPSVTHTTLSPRPLLPLAPASEIRRAPPLPPPP